MNLYLISQTKNNTWDTYDAAVVAAETEDEARVIVPRSSRFQGLPKEESYLDDWTTPENVKVHFIGIAAKGTKSKVILASFNAG